MRKPNLYELKRLTNSIPKTQSEKDKHLFIAAGKGHAKRVIQLLNAGANVNFIGSECLTPLQNAILNRRHEIIDTLLNTDGINIETVN